MTIGKVINTVNGTATERILLTADEGMALLSPEGEQWNCVAVDSTDGWTEITAPTPDDEDEADYIPRHTEGRELKSTCNLL